mmetsp:Transcript_17887/g.32391  ORF Transcript_17887/g.32391 Transcript_17887/m.32391 type:complete len:395 (-) Transcript_17887:243-1427(-)|eukprot:CAMPEP_0198297718 /NCGR_PEP_ID=MMETSP1449-20131203/37923_1 /TAXON_ID=420275 /ORGANISM="Attheya septentrionalis, Strain CCMP2084" /LENGTH=394 /DNA_ID=CAMNT_0043998747 /DNA_START=52 /DNA_END=1236 /DNA_ORIENTATION=+
MQYSIFFAVTAIAAVAATSIVDLSVDLETSGQIETNTGAQVLNQVLAEFPHVRTGLVLEDGRIVAEYVRDGINASEPWYAWSVTKSWISLLIGMMVDSGLISLEETLYDIWPEDEAVWSKVTGVNVEFRKNVTIQSLLTMSSGLISDPNNEGTVVDGGDAGGDTLADSLSFPTEIGESGKFVYNGVLNIISYVILERSGLSPRQYAAQTVFPSLGIVDSEIEWWKNKDGVETAFHGLFLTNKQMAKFGQLYLQNGMAGPENRLMSSTWVSNSSHAQVDFVTDVGGYPLSGSYGYLFWVINGEWIDVPDAGGFYCALGVGGQDICIHPQLNRVVIQQRDWEQDLDGNLIAAGVAFDPALSFTDSRVHTSNAFPTSAGTSWLHPLSFVVSMLLLSL